MRRYSNYLIEIPSKLYLVTLFFFLSHYGDISNFLVLYIYSPVLLALVSNGMFVSYFRFFNYDWQSYVKAQAFLIILLTFSSLVFIKNISSYDEYLGYASFAILSISILFQRIYFDRVRYLSKMIFESGLKSTVLHFLAVLSLSFLWIVFNIGVAEMLLVGVTLYLLVSYTLIREKVDLFSFGVSYSYYKNKSGSLLMLSLLCTYGLRNMEKVVFNAGSQFEQYMLIYIIFGYIQGLVSQYITAIMPTNYIKYSKGDFRIFPQTLKYIAILAVIWTFIAILMYIFYNSFTKINIDSHLYLMPLNFFIMGSLQFVSTIMNFNNHGVVYKIFSGILSAIISYIFVVLFFDKGVESMVLYQIIYGSTFFILILIGSYRILNVR
jgi:hypothetical protein